MRTEVVFEHNKDEGEHILLRELAGFDLRIPENIPSKGTDLEFLNQKRQRDCLLYGERVKLFLVVSRPDVHLCESFFRTNAQASLQLWQHIFSQLSIEVSVVPPQVSNEDIETYQKHLRTRSMEETSSDASKRAPTNDGSSSRVAKWASILTGKKWWARGRKGSKNDAAEAADGPESNPALPVGVGGDNGMESSTLSLGAEVRSSTDLFGGNRRSSLDFSSGRGELDGASSTSVPSTPLRPPLVSRHMSWLNVSCSKIRGLSNEHYQKMFHLGGTDVDGHNVTILPNGGLLYHLDCEINVDRAEMTANYDLLVTIRTNTLQGVIEKIRSTSAGTNNSPNAQFLKVVSSFPETMDPHVKDTTWNLRRGIKITQPLKVESNSIYIPDETTVQLQLYNASSQVSGVVPSLCIQQIDLHLDTTFVVDDANDVPGLEVPRQIFQDPGIMEPLPFMDEAVSVPLDAEDDTESAMSYDAYEIVDGAGPTIPNVGTPSKRGLLRGASHDRISDVQSDFTYARVQVETNRMAPEVNAKESVRKDLSSSYRVTNINNMMTLPVEIEPGNAHAFAVRIIPIDTQVISNEAGETEPSNLPLSKRLKASSSKLSMRTEKTTLQDMVSPTRKVCESADPELVTYRTLCTITWAPRWCGGGAVAVQPIRSTHWVTWQRPQNEHLFMTFSHVLIRNTLAVHVTVVNDGAGRVVDIDLYPDPKTTLDGVTPSLMAMDATIDSRTDSDVLENTVALADILEGGSELALSDLRDHTADSDAHAIRLASGYCKDRVLHVGELCGGMFRTVTLEYEVTSSGTFDVGQLVLVDRTSQQSYRMICGLHIDV